MSESTQAGPILSEFADDPDMMELVEMFVAELPERVVAMKEMMTEGRIEDLARIAHQLKGASGGYGFSILGAAAAALESSLKAGDDIEAVNAQLHELVSLCERASATTA